MAEMDNEYATLRAELKAWEKEFKSENGRAATPDDIRLVDGLAAKYKRFKALSKSKTGNEQPRQTKASILEPSGSASTSIVRHTKATENDRDPIPATAKPNPFSPVKKTSTATAGARTPQNKPPSDGFLPTFQPFPNLFASPVKHARGKTKISPPTSPNPFVVPTLVLQPDSPFTAARKRIRGEDSVDPFPPDKRRKFMARSQSASQPLFGGWGGVPADNLLAVEQEDILEESPVKPSTLNGAMYKPIFDDVPSASTSRSMTSRTVSLPNHVLFGKRGESKSGNTIQLPGSKGQDPTTSLGNMREAIEQSPEGSEEDLDDENFVQEAPDSMTLLAPTPVKGSSTKQWKPKAGKKSSKGQKADQVAGTDEYEEDNMSGGSESAAVEIGWRTAGPLRPRAQPNVADPDNYVSDDDNDVDLLPASRKQLRRHGSEKEDLQEETVEIDLPDEMRKMLQLSPSKQRINDEALAQDILSGNAERSKRAEVWLPGEFGDEHDSDEWEGEASGWWEAEL